MNGNQPGTAELVPTPQPDITVSGPAPNCPSGVPGQVLAPAPTAKPARRWGGFLPAHGTNEDRPGWWTPDYGGGTSD
jgi:hypothetical protein